MIKADARSIALFNKKFSQRAWPRNIFLNLKIKMYPIIRLTKKMIVSRTQRLLEVLVTSCLNHTIIRSVSVQKMATYKIALSRNLFTFEILKCLSFKRFIIYFGDSYK